jgi:nitrogen fixation protein FixH
MTNDNRQTLISAGDPVNITSKITDNGELTSVLIKVSLASESGTFVNMTDLGEGHYEFNETYAQGGWVFTIKAEDTSGNVNERDGTFLVNA